MHSGQETMDRTVGAGRRELVEEVPVGWKRTEVGVIPEHWESLSVCAIASSTRNAIVGGPFGSDLVAKDYVTHGIPVVRGQNMSGRWVSGSFVFVTPTKAKSLEANLAHPGDIIFTQRGTLGQVSLVPDKPFSAYLVSQSQMKLSVNRKVADPLFLFYFFISFEQQKSIHGRTIQTGVPHINLGILREMPVRLPPLAEQRAIAEALSDVDGLLAALEELIAKKQAVKQAAMQQLLTGKTRLPGFSGKWQTKPIGDFTDCTAGGTPSTLISKYWGGAIRWMNSGELNNKIIHDVEGRITEYGLRESSTKTVPPRCVLVGLAGQGKTRGTVAINTVELCTNQSIAAIYPNESFVPEYLYHNLDARYEELRGLSTGDGGRGGLNLKIIRSFMVPFPHINEQTAIATVLANMDAEIAALERRRDKTCAIKQGMMQQLLTGLIRLVKSETTTEDLAASRPVERKHNWQFNEAVVISVLAKHFGTGQYPLGRMRYTKLSYLLHRREGGRVEGYLKKAAGPYNPQTRYGGPEKIALKKGYSDRHKSRKHNGFIAGPNIDEAEHYFTKWYGDEAVEWLEQFRYSKNDELELLTTVDMTVEDLRKTGKHISVESVKETIRHQPDWRAKLARPIFSDANLARAIGNCQKLFDGSSRQETV